MQLESTADIERAQGEDRLSDLIESESPSVMGLDDELHLHAFDTWACCTCCTVCMPALHSEAHAQSRGGVAVIRRR